MLEDALQEQKKQNIEMHQQMRKHDKEVLAAQVEMKHALVNRDKDHTSLVDARSEVLSG